MLREKGSRLLIYILSIVNDLGVGLQLSAVSLPVVSFLYYNLYLVGVYYLPIIFGPLSDYSLGPFYI